MDDALTLIRDRLEKARAKAVKTEKSWESAKKEVRDLETALKVMEQISGVAVQANTDVNARQRAILSLLPVGEAYGQSPAELYDFFALMEGNEVNIDTFRTTLWRMKDRTFDMGDDLWLVKAEGGEYWKVPGTFNTQERHNQKQGSERKPEPDDEPPF